jgi:hypothetical protein
MDGDLHLLQVVGVAADVHDDALDAQPRPMVYVDYRQRPGQAANFDVLRARRFANWIGHARRRGDRSEMPTDFQTLGELVASSLDDRRFTMVMFAVFAGAPCSSRWSGSTASWPTSPRNERARSGFGWRLALSAATCSD